MPTQTIPAEMPSSNSKWRIGKPPIPHEHGAWFMLYIPLIIPLLAGPLNVIPTFILILVATSAFMGQNAFRLTLKKHHKTSHVIWFSIFSIVLISGVSILLFVFGYSELLLIGVIAAGIYGLHVTISRWSRRRFERSRSGEIMAAAALALTAPSAYIIVNESLDRTAWIIYGACVLFFTSGVFYVNMLISASRTDRTFDRKTHWKSGLDCGGYHLLLVSGLVWAALIRPDWSTGLLFIAYAPVIIRAVHGWRTLSPTLPSLPRVGIKEAVYASWFAVWFQAAIRWVV